MQIPVITRVYVTSSILTTLAVVSVAGQWPAVCEADVTLLLHASYSN